MHRISTILCCILFLLLSPKYCVGAILFQEYFDDLNFHGRGWYDAASGAIDTSEHISGSVASLKCHFLLGGTKCNPADGQYTLRKKFAASDSVYISYWMKHSANWVGSGVSYHPHILMLLTTKNSDYSGLAYTYLTTYIEENQGYPVLSLQDAQNIDETKIGVDLINLTENRSVAGCNGTQSGIGHTSVDCYQNGAVHWNGLVWKGGGAFFFDQSDKTNWHFIESYFQFNTISNGIGQQDGILKYWYDGQLIIDYNNVIMRTGKNLTMKFNQFIIAPYIGNGSPADQTFWIDDLSIATTRPTVGSQPFPPKNLHAQ